MADPVTPNPAIEHGVSYTKQHTDAIGWILFSVLCSLTSMPVFEMEHVLRQCSEAGAYIKGNGLPIASVAPLGRLVSVVVHTHSHIADCLRFMTVADAASEYRLVA